MKSSSATPRSKASITCAGTNEVTFCANLLDAAESNIRPRDELKFGEYTKG